MTVLAERTVIHKDADAGPDVAAWNAANPLHPRSGDGRFSLAGVIAQLVQDWGDIVNHEEFGQRDHEFSEHGMLSLHDDGNVTISRIDDTGQPQTIANLGSGDAQVLHERIELALDEMEGSEYAPSTHLTMNDDDEEDPFPVGVGYGTMSDGTRYLSLDDAIGEGEGLQLTESHARDFLDSLGALRDQQFTYERDKDNPYLIRPLPEDETLMRRTKVSSENNDDVLLGIVDTPTGRRLRLGLGGGENLPERSFTGGPGPMVADLGPDEASEVDRTIGDVITSLKEYQAHYADAMAESDEWDETPSGQRLGELLQTWTLYHGAQSPEGPDGRHVVRADTYGYDYEARKDKDRVYAPPEIREEIIRLGKEQGAIFEAYGIVDEGDIFDSTDVDTAAGTIRFDLYGYDPDTPPDVRITVRPKGTDAEDWYDDVASQYEAYADMTPAQLKKLRKLVVTAFQDAQGNPVTKSAGSATDTPGAGRARALKRYWTRGKGLAKWVRSAHPWSTLRRHLAKYIKDPDKLDRTTSAWFHAATGHWSGERKGKNPLGRG